MYQEKIIEYFNSLEGTIHQIDKNEIEKTIFALKKSRDEKRHIFIMGNGGSAATASHFVGDFNKGLGLGREKRFRFIALNDNMSTVLSLANDVSYEDIFVEQLKNFLDPEDLVIAISGSGNSENILRAVNFAKQSGSQVIGLTGFDGGRLDQLSDIHLHVPIDNMQIVEDIHLIFNHLMMSILSEE